MNHNFGIGYIQNYHEATVEQSRRALDTLDTATVVPLGRRGAYDAFEEAPGIFGVLNEGTNNVAMAVSKRYTPLSHIDGFMPALDAIEHAGIGHNMMVNLENHRDNAELYVLFPDLMVDDGADGMMFGVRFRNSYREKTTFKGHVFCWRVRCLNGSTHAETFGEMAVNAMHYNSHISNLRETIDNFVTDMLSNAYRMEEVVDAAMGSEIVFRDFDEIVNSLNPVTESERHSKEIARAVPLETNRWELFNAVTERASHADRMSWKTRDRLIDSAERKILAVSTFAPIPVAAQ